LNRPASEAATRYAVGDRWILVAALRIGRARRARVRRLVADRCRAAALGVGDAREAGARGVAPRLRDVLVAALRVRGARRASVARRVADRSDAAALRVGRAL